MPLSNLTLPSDNPSPPCRMSGYHQPCFCRGSCPGPEIHHNRAPASPPLTAVPELREFLVLSFGTTVLLEGNSKPLALARGKTFQ